MNIETAIKLAVMLDNAIDLAEHSGSDEVDLLAGAQSLDDEARAELVQAISNAERKS